MTFDLDPQEGIEAQIFFAKCDGRVEGVQMAMAFIKTLYIAELKRKRAMKSTEQQAKPEQE